jgi:CRP-like cAMP-binding protein
VAALWAAGLVQLSDGCRQILSILLAGDIFSSKMVFANALHFSVQALTDVRVSRINRADLKARLFGNPTMFEALAQVCIAESKAADDMLVDLGRRTAEERIAHLILSLTERIARRNVIRDQRYPFPLRQQDIADTLGLTPEHVSRVIGKFRNAKFFELSAGHLQIHDMGKLDRIGRPK